MDPELLSLDRLPLPSLKVYTFLSVLAASSSIYYIWTESDTAFKDIAERSGTRYCSINSDSNLNILIDNAAAAVISKLNVINEDLSNVLVGKSESNFKDISIDNDKSLREMPASGEKPHLATVEGGLEKLTRYFGSEFWWSLSVVENDTDSSQQRNGTESGCINEGFQQLTWQLLHWASQQPHCVWPLVNLAYCALILLSHFVQLSVFGNLRSSEQENIKDQFWNLVFYKVVFVFGVVNVQEVEDAVGWCFFVSVIGFLQLARQLCKERHNYLIMMNDLTRQGEARRHRILTLLSIIFLASISLFFAVIAWFMSSSPKEPDDFLDFKNIIVPFMKPYDGEPDVAASVGYDFNLGLHSAIFMLSEIGLLIIQTFHALTMCLFDHMYFRHKSSKWNPISIFGGNHSSPPSNENEEEDLYVCVSQDLNYRFEISSLLFDLIHHVHMLVCCNLFLSMTSLIVSLQMRMRVRQIHSVLKRRQSFTWLNEHIDRYSDVGLEECEHAYCDNCAICWEPIASQKSKNLPCNHMFHKTCLRKWLLVSMHCPTCRLSLLTEKEAQLRREREPRRVYSPRPAVGIMGLLQTGQTLLDLFGGWDPLPDEYTEGQTIPNNVPMFSDFSVQDWPVQVPTPEASQEQTTTSDGSARPPRKD